VKKLADWVLKILESPEEMLQVEELQRVVWPGSETEIVPGHLLITAAHNGGLAIGAYLPAEDGKALGQIIGFVFGFVGLYFTPDGPRPKHCSHILGVLPEYRNSGIGFALKRAQWQMVRHQGIDRITWTYDPLLSRNAHLNITRLGAVCNTYRRDTYGPLRDGLNVGLPTDRFEVDWWINTSRVRRRLSRRPRLQLDLAHFLAAGARIISPAQENEQGWMAPSPFRPSLAEIGLGAGAPLVLVEIPSDFLALKQADPELASNWRGYTRTLFEDLFERGYLVTDFVFLPGRLPRSYYVLSHGDSTL
jgi:predicted GNAT superfamily acetyltransferase